MSMNRIGALRRRLQPAATRLVLVRGVLIVAIFWTVAAMLGLSTRQSALAVTMGLLGTAVVATTTALAVREERIRSRRQGQARSQSAELARISATVGRTAPIVRHIDGIVGQLQNVAFSRGRPAEPGQSAAPAHPVGATSRRDGVTPALVPFAHDRESVLLDVALDARAMVRLPKTGTEIIVDCLSMVAMRLDLQPDLGLGHVSKAIVVRLSFRDTQNRELPAIGKARFSEATGWYYYGELRDDKIRLPEIEVPAGAVRAHVTLSPWGLADARVRNTVSIHRTCRDSHRLTVRPAKEVRVALICDEFTYSSIAPEVDGLIVTPENWRSVFEKERPELLFCESAWSGADSESRPWKGRVYASDRLADSNRKELLEILAFCRERGIPTAFWNKEDPTHFDDRRHDFVRTAVLFDHIFTTDSDCVSRYKVEYGHKSVHLLPFAVQPRIFNPAEGPDRREPGVLFAGSWYANHVERSKAMATILDAIVTSGSDLSIYDRYWGSDDPLHQYPEPYAPFVQPAVAYGETARLYKKSEYGLTINTVTASRSMFARRAYELAASNTAIISNYSVGLEELFGQNVIFIDRDPQRFPLPRSEFERVRRECLSEVLSHHTYRHRIESVLGIAGVPFRRHEATLTLVSTVSSIAEGREAIATANELNSVRDALVLLISDSVPRIAVADYYREFAGLVDAVVPAEMIGRQAEVESLFSTDYCLVMSPSSQLRTDDIERMLMHAEYAGRPVKANAREQYTYADGEALVDVIVASASYRRILMSPESFSVGEVYNV